MKKPKYTAFLSSVYSEYKRRAKKKQVDFLLDLDTFEILIKDNCYYCGDAPANIGRTWHNKRFNGIFLYNGIDRLDNNRGYEENNVVSCCKLCNTMKFTLTLNEFRVRIRKILKKLG
jgi:hypothetical protein